MNVDVGSFTKISGPTTGNQDIVIPRDMTAAAAGTWAIIFWTAGSDQASGTWDAGYESCIGFTTGAANSYAKSSSSKDAVASALGDRGSSGFPILLYGTDGSSKASASFVSFPNSTHMRINWTTNVNDALFNTVIINYIILSGLTNTKAVAWTGPSSAIDKVVTGVGFSPDLVLSILGSDSTAGPHNAIGVFNKHGQQWGNNFSGGYNANPSDTDRGQQTDAWGYVSSGYLESISVQSHFKSMDTDGFTVNFSTYNPNFVNFVSLCLNGLSSKIGAFTAPVAPGSQVIDTRQNFIPKAAFFSSIGLVSTNDPAAGAAWSLGGTDLTNHRAVALTDVDNVSPTQVKSVGYTGKDIISGTAGATTDAGSVSAVSPTQTTINWTTKDAVAREYLYMLLGDAGVDTFPAKVDV